MDKSDKPHCLLIQSYTEKILEYTDGLSDKEFGNNFLVYDACILNLINIAERIKSLSDEFKIRHPEIPYRKIIGLRNIAAHSYEGLEAFRLFKIVRENIPLLNQQFSEVLKSGYFE